jgi:hypothetical protein
MESAYYECVYSLIALETLSCILHGSKPTMVEQQWEKPWLAFDILRIDVVIARGRNPRTTRVVMLLFSA